MEKVIVALRSATGDDELTARLCGPVAGALLELDMPGVTVNVRDAPVRRDNAPPAWPTSPCCAGRRTWMKRPG